MIGILDYGMGNTRSVLNALEFVGSEAALIRPEGIERVDGLILPGVGAFGDTAVSLEPYRKDLLGFIGSGKPFLGICVGLQYLYEGSDENGYGKGLGLLKGWVAKLDFPKLPQIGWNTLEIRNGNPLLDGIESGDYVYYINTFAAGPAEADAVSIYGNVFCAAASSDNVFGTQFHPEKSGDVGLRMLRNFDRMVEDCS